MTFTIYIRYITLITLLYFLVSCSNKDRPVVKIATNPWPGYEFLYLAEQKGIFERVGLNAKILQLGSLADAKRTFVNGYADGLGSTIVEAVQAQNESDKPLKIVMIPDFSNGGDVIVSRKEFTSVKALKGAKVGCEVTSLGIYILQRALVKSGLTLNDVTVVNVEQVKGKEALLSGEIDAFVTYPPSSVSILKDPQFHTVFSSAEIPKEIIDTISISEEALKANPDFVKKLHKAWDLALDFYKSNPDEAVSIMAAREGISNDEFLAVLNDVQVLPAEDQIKIFEEPDRLQTSVKEVCNTLVFVESIDANCNAFPDIIYRGDISS